MAAGGAGDTVDYASVLQQGDMVGSGDNFDGCEPLPLPTDDAATGEGVTYKIFDKEGEIAEIVALIDKWGLFAAAAPPPPPQAGQGRLAAQILQLHQHSTLHTKDKTQNSDPDHQTLITLHLSLDTDTAGTSRNPIRYSRTATSSTTGRSTRT